MTELMFEIRNEVAEAVVYNLVQGTILLKHVYIHFKQLKNQKMMVRVQNEFNRVTATFGLFRMECLD